MIYSSSTHAKDTSQADRNAKMNVVFNEISSQGLYFTLSIRNVVRRIDPSADQMNYRNQNTSSLRDHYLIADYEQVEKPSTLLTQSSI
jgi:hypothetical protein